MTFQDILEGLEHRLSRATQVVAQAIERQRAFIERQEAHLGVIGENRPYFRRDIERHIDRVRAIVNLQIQQQRDFIERQESFREQVRVVTSKRGPPAGSPASGPARPGDPLR